MKIYPVPHIACFLENHHKNRYSFLYIYFDQVSHENNKKLTRYSQIFGVTKM